MQSININVKIVKTNFKNHSTIRSETTKNETIHHRKKVSSQLREKGFDVKPILLLTVLEGQERFHFVYIPSIGKEEITKVINSFSGFYDSF